MHCYQLAAKVGSYLRDGRKALISHFDQLTLHSNQLVTEGAVLKNANSNGYESRTRYDHRGPSRSMGKTILGFFLLALGFPLLALAFYFDDTPRPQREDRWLTWGTGLVAGLLIAQGTALALSENWLP